MTHERDIERLLDRWLDDGQSTAPDRIVEGVADRIGRQRQRNAWRLLWRDPVMNPIIKPAGAIAAVALVALLGLAVVGLQSGSNTGGPSPSPSPAPPPVCVRGPCLGLLAAGSHTATEPLTPFAYVVPDGWENVFNTAGGYVLQRQAEPSAYSNAIYVFLDLQAADQTACAKGRESGVGQSVDELVTWLGSLPGVSMTTPTAITLGGLSGVTFDLTVSGEGRVCDGEMKLWVQEWSGDPDFWWGIAATAKERVLLLDRGSGETVFVILDAPTANFEAFAAAATPIVDSFDFGPAASPVESRNPSASSCATSEPACTGLLDVGTHSTSELITPITYTVPAGWSKALDVPGSVNLSPAGSTSFIGIWPDWNVAAQDGCVTVPSAEPGWGRTVEELVRSLTEHPGIITTAPTAVTRGGLNGQFVDVEKDPNVDGACGGGTTVNLFTHQGTIEDVGALSAVDGERMRLYFFDVGAGHVVNVAVVVTDAADFDSFVATATPVVNSIVFN